MFSEPKRMGDCLGVSMGEWENEKNSEDSSCSHALQVGTQSNVDFR